IPSRKLRSLISAYCYFCDIELPKPQAMTEIVAILEGAAILNPQPCELPDMVEADPVLHGLLALFETSPEKEGRENDGSVYEGTATDLLVALERLSQKRGW